MLCKGAAGQLHVQTIRKFFVVLLKTHKRALFYMPYKSPQKWFFSEANF
jgi:hypothetical protein